MEKLDGMNYVAQDGDNAHNVQKDSVPADDAVGSASKAGAKRKSGAPRRTNDPPGPAPSDRRRRRANDERGKKKQRSSSVSDDGLSSISTPDPEQQLSVARASGGGHLQVVLELPDTPDDAPHVDEGSESSSEIPTFGADVDDFIIQADSKPLSVTMLPVWIHGEMSGGHGCPEKVFLVGTTADTERLPFKERVIMWSLVFDPKLSPRFILKTSKGTWVRLWSPDDSYSALMRDAVALAHFLNFVKQYPNASAKSAEKYMQKECTMDGEKTFLLRLSRHLEVLKNYVRKDEILEKAKVLREIFPNLLGSNGPSPQRDDVQAFKCAPNTAGMQQKAGKSPLKSENTDKKEKRYKVMVKKDVRNPKAFVSGPHLDTEGPSVAEKKGNFFRKRHCGQSYADQEYVKQRMDDDSNLDYQPHREPKQRSENVQRSVFTRAEIEVEDPPICILCDDGGNLIYCEGPCERHFHPTVKSGADSGCETLRLTRHEVKAMGKYYCKNCEHDQHQCFICGELGPSASTSHGLQEVKQCDVWFCKRFYHMECAAQMLSTPNTNWRDLATDFLHRREKLYCPRHCCSVCGRAELDVSGMLVQCRRCPKAWHKDCLSKSFPSGELATTPIWTHHDRDFLYCKNHSINPMLQTPVRDHVRFPTL